MPEIEERQATLDSLTETYNKDAGAFIKAEKVLNDLLNAQEKRM
jgi:hypothetical protein